MASTPIDTKCAGQLYKHQPLDVEKYQVRLLKLCNPLEHTMEYHLVTFDFESVPSYVALSYTWGEEHPTGFIKVDGKDLEIRINLFNFLETYKPDEYIWIDQICIDQSNLEEQSHQVRMMWKIYTQCDFVLVWLRDESICIPSTRQAALDFNNGVESYPSHDQRANGSSADKKFVDWPTLALLHNSYFERLWVVQELLLSKDIRILVEGNVWVSWKLLRRKHEEIRDGIQKILPSTSWMVDSQLFRFAFASHTPVSTTYYTTLTVGKFCDKQCQDPRDKVYGLMALVQPSSRVAIDYKKPTHRVFLDAIMSMIREYWYMKHENGVDGYQLHKVKWKVGQSVHSSRNLAQSMNFTDLETSGLRSFVECIWERVLRCEVTAKLSGLRVDPNTYCITSVGFEPETHQLPSDERLTATCKRWWYEYKGKRYYHDCKEWSGKAKDQEYTAPF